MARAKKQREDTAPKVCCLCGENFKLGEVYHSVVSRRGRKFFHDKCYKEMIPHGDTGARH